MLYLLLLKRSLAYILRPLSGLVRISVEEGRVSNRFSGGCSTGGEELFFSDVDEERTWDLSSFACLLVRMSAKDIVFSVDGTALYSCTIYRIIPESAALISHSAPTNSDKRKFQRLAFIDLPVPRQKFAINILWS